MTFLTFVYVFSGMSVSLMILWHLVKRVERGDDKGD